MTHIIVTFVIFSTQFWSSWFPLQRKSRSRRVSAWQTCGQQLWTAACSWEKSVYEFELTQCETNMNFLQDISIINDLDGVRRLLVHHTICITIEPVDQIKLKVPIRIAISSFWYYLFSYVMVIEESGVGALFDEDAVKHNERIINQIKQRDDPLAAIRYFTMSIKFILLSLS